MMQSFFFWSFKYLKPRQALLTRSARQFIIVQWREKSHRTLKNVVRVDSELLRYPYCNFLMAYAKIVFS